MLRTTVLEKAAQLVTKDRASEHGDAYDNLELVANLWSAYINGRYELALLLRPNDVADLMELLKLGRRAAAPSNIENYTDACGYAALSYEMVMKIRENGL